MGFADIINNAKKEMDNQNDNEKVQYPQSKHPRLFYENGATELVVQVLPSADLVSEFAVPARKIFINAKTSTGKDLNINFILDPQKNEGSYLEQKIEEWTQKQMMPSRYGQQTAKHIKFVNVVRIVQQNGQWIQERDAEGNLAVRVFEMPISAYNNLIRKLGDPMNNISGTEFSFMDINKPAPVKISKPANGSKEYAVDVYTNLALPPLGAGWESQLEDLHAHATPTERLVNGQQWVNAFVDIKEGRKPNQNNGQAAGGQQTPPTPQTNPYGAAPQSTPQVPPTAPPVQNQVPPQTQAQPQADPFAAPPQGQAPVGQPSQSPFEINNTPLPNAGANTVPPVAPPTAPPVQAQPSVPQQPPTAPPVQNQTATTPPAQPNVGAAPHAVDLNSQGLQDLDSMIDSELNGGM
jgi:hypothetical protein